jgi:hypothetical protein
MLIKKKLLAIALLLLLTAFASAVLSGGHDAADDARQITFLTNFYKAYLFRQQAPGIAGTRPAGFYSRRAEAAIAENIALCSTLSPGDKLCGYGAGGDVFLDSREIAPDLNFSKSDFKAIRTATNTVDVTFTTWPEYGVDAYRTLRYVLVKEDAAWRVDDVYPRVGGTFPANGSMRHLINEENQRLRAAAAEAGKPGGRQ